MPRMNWSRALLGGVVAGAVWGFLYAPVHPLVEAHDSLGRPVLPITPFRGATPVMRVLLVINGFLQGIATVWIYAAIRPRFGPGPKTAAIAAFVVWALASFNAYDVGGVHRHPPRGGPAICCGKSPAPRAGGHGRRLALQGMSEAVGRSLAGRPAPRFAGG